MASPRPASPRAVQPVADRRLVAQVGLEYQPERLAGAPDEVEERGEGGGHPLLVVGRGRQRIADGGGQGVHALIEQRQVELKLAGKVLVEHGFADPCLLRYLVHRSSVVSLCDEDLPRSAQELPSPGGLGQSRPDRPDL